LHGFKYIFQIALLLANTYTDSWWKEGRIALEEQALEQDDPSRSDDDDVDYDDEDALKNGDLPCGPVRVLEALAENNDFEQSAVYHLRHASSPLIDSLHVV